MYTLIVEFALHKFTLFDESTSIWYYLQLILESFIAASVYLMYLLGKLRSQGKILFAIRASIVIYGAGLIFKVLHLPGASFMIFYGLISLILSYLISFFMRNPKDLLDYLKLLWVVLFSFQNLNVFQLRWLDARLVGEIVNYILLMIVIYFHYHTFFENKNNEPASE